MVQSKLLMEDVVVGAIRAMYLLHLRDVYVLVFALIQFAGALL